MWCKHNISGQGIAVPCKLGHRNDRVRETYQEKHWCDKN